MSRNYEVNDMNRLIGSMGSAEDNDYTQLPTFLVSVSLRNKLVERGFNKEMAEDVVANMDIIVSDNYYDTDEKRELADQIVIKMADMIVKYYDAYKSEFARWELFIKMIGGADITLR